MEGYCPFIEQAVWECSERIHRAFAKRYEGYDFTLSMTDFMIILTCTQRVLDRCVTTIPSRNPTDFAVSCKMV